MNYKDLERIIYSKDFRNLQNKTQLFYTTSREMVRTRLTHSIEVKMIAHKIGIELNHLIIKNNRGKDNVRLQKLDLDLIDAIAFAHDIGHTPFGHIGERTINEVFYRSDDLGGILNSKKGGKMLFKHNVNSMRIIKELHSNIDPRIIDGVLFHTKIYPKGIEASFDSDPYGCLQQINKSKFKSVHDISLDIKSCPKEYSITIEGQIVAIADEIAQRISDTNDGVKSSFFNKIKDIFNENTKKFYKYDKSGDDDKSKAQIKDDIESFIKEEFVNSVSENFRSLLDKINNAEIKLSATNNLKNSDYAYNNIKMVDFDEEFSKINDLLEKFILCHIALSEDIRLCDSKSKYILRQIFKAFIKDVTLLPDDVIIKYFNKLSNEDAFKALSGRLSAGETIKISDVDNEESCGALCALLKQLKSQKWHIKNYGTKDRLVLDFDVINEFIHTLANNDHHGESKELDELYNLYIRSIGYYVASMTDNEAFMTYSRIYGHLPD